MGSQKNCSKVACSPDNMCAVQFVFGVEGVKVKVDEQTGSQFFTFSVFKNKNTSRLTCTIDGNMSRYGYRTMYLQYTQLYQCTTTDVLVKVLYMCVQSI